MTINCENKADKAKEIIKAGIIKHIAVIMDGNRRWAVEKNVHKTSGHNAGRKAFKNIVKHSAAQGLSCLTTYAFSTENWGRDQKEVSFLMNLFVESLKNEVRELNENNIRLKFIGRRDRLNNKIIDMMEQSEEITAKNTGMIIQVALDYGSRFEITNTIKIILQKLQNNEITIEDVDENLINENLYTSNVPDPDLIIRTGGEYRLSNYLLWQAAYSELYITNTYWPEFSSDELDSAIINFSQRQRRWGKD